MSDIWEPWSPDVGQRVRIRVSAECPIHGQPDYPLSPDLLNDRVGWVKADSRTTLGFFDKQPGATKRLESLGHWWFVRFDAVLIEHEGRPINAEDFCAAELEPLS